MSGAHRHHQRGMLLPALLVLLAIGGAGWLLAQQESAAHRDLRREHRSADALASAREALLGYAVTYRNREHPTADFGYLPCPDLDGDGSSETCGSQGATSIGRLPYLTLNLPDLRDGGGECLWYVVSGNVKNNPKPPSLNWESSGQLQLDGESGQAAAIVIAAGPPQPGQQRSPGPARCGGDSEARQISQYVEAIGTTTNGITAIQPGAGNDRIAVITIDDIFTRLKRRPSYAAWLQSVLQATADCLARPTLPAAVSPERLGPVELGRLPAPATLSGRCRDEGLRDAVDNWHGLLRYARCSTDTDCLAGIDRRCRGALVFAGERDASPQVDTPAESGNARTGLEPATIAALAAGQVAALPSAITLSATRRNPADVALCIP